jgi:hypothetical protein
MGIGSLLGAWLAAGAVLLGIPIVLAGIAHYGIRQVAEPEYVQVPLLIKLTVTAGMILGVGLLAAVARPEYYMLENVLRVDGPWNLDVTRFLSVRVNPLELDVTALVDRIRYDDPTGNLAILFGAPALLAAVMVVACYVYWRPLPATVCALVSLIAIAITAYVVFYLVCGALWLGHLLSFWMLLILAILIQRRKHAL